MCCSHIIFLGSSRPEIMAEIQAISQCTKFLRFILVLDGNFTRISLVLHLHKLLSWLWSKCSGVLSLSDSSAKLHRLEAIRTEEAGFNKDEELEHSDNVEEKSEEEFELQPVSLKEKVTKKSKKPNQVEGKRKKKRKSEGDELNVTAKKSKKTEKNNKKDSKKTAKEGKKVGKKRLTSKSKDKVETQNVTDDTIEDETGSTAWTHSNVDIGQNSEKNISHKEQNGTALSKDIRVDPKKIFRIEDCGNEVEGGESDSLQQKRIDIQQAFANDDVVEEFVKEKSEIEDASKPKDIDLSLPGWGAWAGVGIKPSEKKKKVFTKKADPAPPRKDKGLSHVTINEEKSKLFSKNQVRIGFRLQNFNFQF